VCRHLVQPPIHHKWMSVVVKCFPFDVESSSSFRMTYNEGQSQGDLQELFDASVNVLGGG